ncbi:MAG: SCO family protein [Candidatus Kapaibacterium sp.]
MTELTTEYRIARKGFFSPMLMLATLFLCYGTDLLAQQEQERMDKLGKSIEVEQKLDAQVDLNLTFTNEDGTTVRLGDYFDGEKPVVLTLVYYGCPMLCGQVLNGTVRGLKDTDLEVGEDYNIVSISFDHTETVDVAAKKRRTFLRQFHREGADKGWHFLVSDSASVAKVAEQVGFKYHKDEETGQYAHSAAIMVLTPSGKVSRYFFGIEYDPKDLQLGLVEASNDKIGSLADQVLLLCFEYNPITGKYGFAISTSLKIAGSLTLLLLVGFIVRSIRRDKKESEAHNVGLQGGA